MRLQECARLSELAAHSQREAETLRSDLERARTVAAQDLQVWAGVCFEGVGRVGSEGQPGPER